MNAFDSVRFDDLRQRQANNEQLTKAEQSLLARLFKQDRDEWEREEQPRWLGGDYPDVF